MSSTFLALALTVGGAGTALAQVPQTTHEVRRAAKIVPGEVLVRFAPGTPASDRSVSARVGVATAPNGLDGVRRVKLSAGISLASALEELRSRPDVLYAEPNLILSATDVPNDPHFTNQWGLEQINGPEAWSQQTGSPNVIVAVVDTGVEATHPALAANMWTNRGEIASNGIDDDKNGYVDDVGGWDVANSDNDPSDIQGHGTHVAGIAAATGNDGIGTSGTSWDASIMPVRALDDKGVGTTLGISKAINYAVNNGARVVNLSLGGDGYSQTLATAITEAKETLFVVSAGNGGSDGVGDDTSVSPSFPCNMPAENLICVAASDSNDSLTSFSNYGVSVDLAAPGRTIYSTYPGAKYSYASGTSMATPFVSGAAALLWAEKTSASTSDIRRALLDGVEKVSALTGKVATGGRLDLQGALQLVAGGSVSEPEPTPTPTEEPEPSPSPEPTDDGNSGGGLLPGPELTPLPLQPSPTPTSSPEPSPSPEPTSDPIIDPGPELDPEPEPEPEPEPVMAEELTVSVVKRSHALRVSGSLEPGLDGVVKIVLARRKGGRFVKVADRLVSLDVTSLDRSIYATKFRRPSTSKCRLTSTYTRDGVTVTARRLFNC